MKGNFLKNKNGSGFYPVATRHIGYATHVQDWTRVMYPTCPVALATGQKLSPIKIWNCYIYIYIYTHAIILEKNL